MTQFLAQNGGPWGSILVIADEENGALWRSSINFQSRQRLKSQWMSNNFCELWPNSRAMSGDASVPLAMFGQTAADRADYEVTELGVGAMARHYFIRGTCKDSVGAGVSGANVQGFLTVGDIFIGEFGADSDGTYSFPSAYITSAHYLVAYRPGSPDITGATVNTLIPVL